jgi:hypothetical protein
MTTTTIAAIKAHAEKYIRGLDPTGSAMGAGKYRVANSGHGWENRPSTETDRCFTVENFKRTEPMFFGSTSETDYRITFEVIIGHVLAAANREACQTRRDTDIFQIAQYLEESGNFPSGCSIVRLLSSSIAEKSDRWITTLTFDAQMSYTI